MSRQGNTLSRWIKALPAIGRRGVLVALVTLICGGLAVRALARIRPGAIMTALVPVATQAMANEEKVVTILRANGFEPDSATRSGGQFQLLVANRSGETEMTFVLKRENGDVVREIAMPQGALEWSEAIDVSPGSYVLTVANHPEWVCSITVQ